MSLDDSQLEFLWCLFQHYFVYGAREDAVQWAMTMYEHSLFFPEKIELLIRDFLEKDKDSALIDAATTAVRQFYFEPERHVMLVAILVDKGAIGVNEAAMLLTFDGVNTNKLPKSIRRVIDVAGFVNEDSRDGVMKLDDDSLLIDALRDVIRKKPA